MWIHGLLYVFLLLIFIGEKAGWIPPQMLKGRKKRLFFGALLAGNLLGTLLTVMQNRELALDKGTWFQRGNEEEGFYEEKLLVEAEDGRSCEIVLEIPWKEGEPPKEKEQEKTLSFQEAIQGEVLRLNEERQDPEKYYLPDSYQGLSLNWERKRKQTGTMLAMLGLIAGIFLPAAVDQEVRRQEQKRKEQVIWDYPGLVMKLTLFMEAGMSVRRAFQKVGLDYKKCRESQGNRYAYEELLQSVYEMENGITEGEAYLRFGQRCNEAHYKTLATLLVQNLKKGNQGLVEMLEQESVQAWEDRKRKARILGEAAATKLLVPMVLMLLVVIAILMIPAGLSFYN